MCLMGDGDMSQHWHGAALVEMRAVAVGAVGSPERQRSLALNLSWEQGRLVTRTSFRDHTEVGICSCARCSF
jgi:hypothetical protein